jgi:pyruvate/2-oxoglutarate dehydrogenase complex dihydrolipoamide dehydrogenase (E3) component
VTVIRGHGRFIEANTVGIGNTRIQAEKIFINVGASPTIPPVPGLERVPFLTSSTILDLDVLPRHLVIIGGSYIGLEFAQIYRRFGSEVTIVEQGSRLIKREDSDVSDAIRMILEKEGIRVRLNAECIRVHTMGNDIVVGLDCDGGTREVAGSHLLLAVGRTPNTIDLGLENVGIAVDASGHIPVDDQLRTSMPGLWALGDCNGKGGFTHTSYNDYEIVTANLLDHDERRISDRIMAYGLFIDPPLGRVGMTESQVRASGRPALIGRRTMDRVRRAIEKGETAGFMKIIVDVQTKQILGAAILGTGGDEAIHSVLDVMYAKAPYTVISRAVHIHPTVSELIPTILGDLVPLGRE